MKKLLVSHLSALRYWRSANDLEVAKAKVSRVNTIAGSITSVKQARTLAPANHGLIMSEEYPLDILVPSARKRLYAKRLSPHAWSGPVPPGAFRRIANGLYISSPEFVFLQLAGTLDVIELARLGNELCGTYNLRRNAKSTKRNKPLTTKAKIERLVNRAKGAFGATKAKQALRWVCDNSNSPQETNMLLALCLPKSLGGYSLPLPTLNPKIQVGERLVEYLGDKYYYPDALWVRTIRGKRVNVTVEYDSHEYHDEESDAERTRIRRNEFNTMGYRVTSINKSQMQDGVAFLRAARQIARDLGIWRKAATITEISACGTLLSKLADEQVF